MAGASAASLLSLTISAAAVTVVAVGGILAGPSIVDCSQQGGDVGACLRGKLDRVTQRMAGPVVSPVAVQPGLIDAKAAEFSPAEVAVAELTAVPGTLMASGLVPIELPTSAVDLTAPAGAIVVAALPSSPPLSAEVTLVAPMGALAARGLAPSRPAPVLVALTEVPGVLSAMPILPEPQVPIGRIELRAPTSRMLVDAIDFTPTAPAIAKLTASGGSLVALALPLQPAEAWPSITLQQGAIPEATGLIGPDAGGTAVVTLNADLAPQAPLAVPSQSVSPLPNRRSGDVLLLPPPSTGANSSFAVLQLN